VTPVPTSKPSSRQLPTTDEQVQTATLRWVQRFVVELNLCPFASRVSPHVAITRANSEQNLLAALTQELEALLGDDNRETTLLVHPDVLGNFLDYNDFLAVTDELITANQLEGVVQIASFHPEYQFAGTQPDDPENFANRSPFPMLHLLREDSVTRAVDSHPDVEQIVLNNARVLDGLGADALRKRRRECFADD